MSFIRMATAICCGIFTTACLTLAGCSGSLPTIYPPNIDADEAARRAMELHDADGDGYVAGDELEQAPALQAALGAIDGDGDGKASAEEIATLIRSWGKTQIGLMSIRCTVLLDGRPVDDAEVIYQPAAFLGGALKPAVGITNRQGIANLSILKENRPSPDSPPGVQFGLYQVRITRQLGGGKSIPSKYNVETTLGQEVSFRESRIFYRLKSR